MNKYRYALISLVVGIALSVPVINSMYRFFSESPGLFDSENRATIVTTEPGDITVWYFSETIIDGRYTTFDAFPEGIIVRAKFGVVDLPVRVDKSTTINLTGGERKSAFKISAEEIGEYNISIEDMPKEMRFAVTFGKGFKSFIIGLMQFGLGAVFLAAACVLAVLAAANVFPKKDNRLTSQFSERARAPVAD